MKGSNVGPMNPLRRLTYIEFAACYINARHDANESVGTYDIESAYTNYLKDYYIKDPQWSDVFNSLCDEITQAEKVSALQEAIDV